MSVRLWSPNLHEAVILLIGLTPARWSLFTPTPPVSLPVSASPSDDRRLTGSAVDDSARLAGVAFQEGPGRAQIAEASVEAADGGVAVDGRLGLPRDLAAGTVILPPRRPLPARP